MLTALLCAATTLAGCGAGTSPLAQTDTDPTIVGSTTSPLPPSSTNENLSDEITIRNAVSSADLSQPDASRLAWANADTGSRGAISALVEDKRDGVLCRSFTTTRESFEGVALYRGQACMDQPGVWKMLEFKAN